MQAAGRGQVHNPFLYKGDSKRTGTKGIEGQSILIEVWT